LSKKNILKNKIYPLILAGGKGSRLGEITKRTPKPILEINNKLFIIYLLEQIYKLGLREVTISVGYKSEMIKNKIGNSYKSLKIFYSKEQNLLGTGGAIKKFIKDTKKELLLVMNGDSYTKLNFEKFFKSYSSFMNIFLVGCRLKNSSRFGKILIDKDMKIVEFGEKKHTTEGIINCGIYIINKKIFDHQLKNTFSFEKEILSFPNEKNYYCWPYAEFMYDIGTKNSYNKSKEFFKKNVF
tara:strand:- start:2043 stop:2762 length:720 start_codon:yes stop_codon:yes gene_type:complete